MDDLASAAVNCQEIIHVITSKYHLKLKVTGTISYYLSMDFFRNSDGTLCMAPRKYIEKICDSFERMFGYPPKMYHLQ